MTTYLISYDLRKQRDYQKLYDAIRSYGTFAHILESTWAVVTTKTAVEVFDHLQQYIDSDDGLFVVRSGSEAAWVNVLCDSGWLKKHL